jgi:hypothetical protein
MSAMNRNVTTPTRSKPMFRSLNDVRGLDLYWEQPSILRSAYELKAGEETVAVMIWDGGLNTAATVESSDGAFRLAQDGFWKQHVVVTGPSGEEILRFEYHSDRQSMVLADGKKLNWTNLNWWRNVWGFTDENDRELIRMEMGYRGFMRAIGIIRLEPGSEGLPLVQLLSLGWFLYLVYQSEAASGAVTAATATG